MDEQSKQNLLKLVTSLKDMSKVEKMDSQNFNIVLSKNLKSYFQIQNVLETYQVQYVHSNSKSTSPLPEINLLIPITLDLKSIKFLSSVMGSVYSDEESYIYFHYASIPKNLLSHVFFGTILSSKLQYTNLSRPVKPSELENLDLNAISKENFISLFRNLNYDEAGRIYIIEDEPEYDNDPDENYTERDMIDDAYEGDASNLWNTD